LLERIVKTASKLNGQVVMMIVKFFFIFANYKWWLAVSCVVSDGDDSGNLANGKMHLFLSRCISCNGLKLQKTQRPAQAKQLQARIKYHDEVRVKYS
jgi:hypothetical protein